MFATATSYIILATDLLKMLDHIKRNSEEGFALASVLEFFHLRRSRREASLTIECKDGEAKVNFNCSLGYPDQQHVSKTKAKKRKSANRASRDNTRAAAYQAERGLLLLHGHQQQPRPRMDHPVARHQRLQIQKGLLPAL